MYIVIYIYMNIHNIFFENTDINNQCKPLNTHSILLIWIFQSYFSTVARLLHAQEERHAWNIFQTQTLLRSGPKGVSLCARERERGRERERHMLLSQFLDLFA